MAVEVTIDGEEVPWKNGSVTPRLNAPSQGTVTVPMQNAIGDTGSRVQIFIDGVRAIHGRCTDTETSAGEDTGYTVYKVTDPMELWDKRPARDPDGDFSKPSFIEVFDTGPQIMEAILDASENAGGGPPADAEGDLEVQLGSFATGGVSLAGAPTDWPMTIQEIAALLISTGQLDVVCVPIDSGGDMARIDCYNGNYGNDLTGSVSLGYGLGAYNVRELRWNRSLLTVINKLWIYLGPRVGTPLDPAGDQHWRANIVSTDPGLATLPGSPVAAVNARRVASQAAYGVRMEIEIYDALGDAEFAAGHDLYRWQWLAKSWMAAVPREIIHVTPTRGSLVYGTFDRGDLIAVAANTAVRGGFSGAQRIYEYTATFDEDSVIQIAELQTSPDNEGF